jgi:hypothetical protein
VQRTVVEDIGHLHALAGAASIGPSVLNGADVFGTALSWPLSDFFGHSFTSPGVFIVEQTQGFQTGRWGVHSSLIGDAYLTYGAIGLALTTTLFGYAIKLLYLKLRRGEIRVPIHVLIILYSYRIFLESIDKWAEGLVVTAFAYAIIRVSDVLFGNARPASPMTEVQGFSR